MQKASPSALSWAGVLSALRDCAGEHVLVRDGKLTEPAASIGTRASAKGTELSVFAGEPAAKRVELIERLEALAKSSGRRFMTTARAVIGGSALLVDAVNDDTVDGVLCTVIKTRRSKLGFNQSQQTGATTTLRSKRIKNG